MTVGVRFLLPYKSLPFLLSSPLSSRFLLSLLPRPVPLPCPCSFPPLCHSPLFSGSKIDIKFPWGDLGHRSAIFWSWGIAPFPSTHGVGANELSNTNNSMRIHGRRFTHVLLHKLLPLPKKVMFLVRSVCMFVCLFVCLSVRRITEKFVNGFLRNFLEG